MKALMDYAREDDDVQFWGLDRIGCSDPVRLRGRCIHGPKSWGDVVAASNQSHAALRAAPAAPCN